MHHAKLAPIRLDIDPRLGVRYKYPSLEPIRRLTGGGIMKFPQACLPPTPWGQLPPLLRLLLISPFEETGRWLRSALADDQAIEIVLVEVSNLADGLARLREEPFDTVLLDHDPEALDALVAIDTIRTGTSADQPIVVRDVARARDGRSLFRIGGRYLSPPSLDDHPSVLLAFVARGGTSATVARKSAVESVSDQLPPIGARRGTSNVAATPGNSRDG